MYHLLKNPDKLHILQAEVDLVLGNGPIELHHLAKLKYLDACVKETLRCQGPIGIITVHPKEDTVIGGKYFVDKNTSIILNIKGNHHDPKIWGADHQLFRPERFLNGGFEALPPNSFKPFGNGSRACIGRAFAEQEMMLATALIFQRFQIEMADPGYNLSEFSPKNLL